LAAPERLPLYGARRETRRKPKPAGIWAAAAFPICVTAYRRVRRAGEYRDPPLQGDCIGQRTCRGPCAYALVPGRADELGAGVRGGWHV